MNDLTNVFGAIICWNIACELNPSWDHSHTKRKESLSVTYDYVETTYLSMNCINLSYAFDTYFVKWRPDACNFIKTEIPIQVFSCEFGDSFKNTFLYRAPPVAKKQCFSSLSYTRRQPRKITELIISSNWFA